MNILTIGNSFSDDATRYLHQIARKDGVNLQITNVSIGGCPLSAHYKTVYGENKRHRLVYNGFYTSVFVSLQEILAGCDWDYVSLQQVSHKAPYYETYQPYLNELADMIREIAPEAKILIHQTWAYAQDSKRLTEELGYEKHQDMFKDVQASYKKAAEEIGAYKIIPCGEVFQKMLELGAEKIHRDGFHADFGFGRYALGLTWYRALTGRDVTNHKFDPCDFDVEVNEKEIEIAKKAVMAVLTNP